MERKVLTSKYLDPLLSFINDLRNKQRNGNSSTIDVFVDKGFSSGNCIMSKVTTLPYRLMCETFLKIKLNLNQCKTVSGE